MCTKYWLTACSSLPRKSVVTGTDCPAMTIGVDFGRKATKQTKFRVRTKKIFLIFEPKHVMGTQKNHLNETVILRKLVGKKIFITLG